MIIDFTLEKLEKTMYIVYVPYEIKIKTTRSKKINTTTRRPGGGGGAELSNEKQMFTFCRKFTLVYFICDLERVNFFTDFNFATLAARRKNGAK